MNTFKITDRNNSDQYLVAKEGWEDGLLFTPEYLKRENRPYIADIPVNSSVFDIIRGLQDCGLGIATIKNYKKSHINLDYIYPDLRPVTQEMIAYGASIIPSNLFQIVEISLGIRRQSSMLKKENETLLRSVQKPHIDIIFNPIASEVKLLSLTLSSNNPTEYYSHGNSHNAFSTGQTPSPSAKRIFVPEKKVAVHTSPQIHHSCSDLAQRERESLIMFFSVPFTHEMLEKDESIIYR